MKEGFVWQKKKQTENKLQKTNFKLQNHKKQTSNPMLINEMMDRSGLLSRLHYYIFKGMSGSGVLHGLQAPRFRLNHYKELKENRKGVALRKDF